jgi:hypothetical protein
MSEPQIESQLASQLEIVPKAPPKCLPYAWSFESTYQPFLDVLKAEAECLQSSAPSSPRDLLKYAIEMEDPALVSKALAAGADPNSETDDDCESPIYCAVGKHFNEAVMERLLAAGGQPWDALNFCLRVEPHRSEAKTRWLVTCATAGLKPWTRSPHERTTVLSEVLSVGYVDTAAMLWDWDVAAHGGKSSHDPKWLLEQVMLRTGRCSPAAISFAVRVAGSDPAAIDPMSFMRKSAPLDTRANRATCLETLLRETIRRRPQVAIENITGMLLYAGQNGEKAFFESLLKVCLAHEPTARAVEAFWGGAAGVARQLLKLANDARNIELLKAALAYGAPYFREARASLYAEDHQALFWRNLLKHAKSAELLFRHQVFPESLLKATKDLPRK